jgi:hypothetical protein
MQETWINLISLLMATIAKVVARRDDPIWNESHLNQSSLLWIEQEASRQNYRIVKSVFLKTV